MSFLDDALGILGSVAPTIATAIGGPFAGQAVQAVAGLFGLGDTASKDDLLQAVGKATPEQLAALRKIDADFAVQMKTLEVDLHRIHAGDRDSARNRESTTGDSWTPRILAFVTSACFFGCVTFVFTSAMSSMDPVQMTLIGTVIGYASAKLDSVLSYYFGSSVGSDSKDAMLARSTPMEMRKEST